jgi:hypothetical protein
MSVFFEQQLGDPALTPLEAEVLDRAVTTGFMSAADYEQVHSVFEQCMLQHGVDLPWKKGTDGVYYPVGYDTTQVGFTDAQFTVADRECEPLQSVVQYAYQMQQSNPDLLKDPSEQALACLRRRGIVDASYAIAQFKQEQTAGGMGQFPFDPFDPVANACLAAAGFLYLFVDN